MTSAHLNRDGSEDLGYMQVNTRWVPVLSRYTGQPQETVRQNLLSRVCYNIAAAGLIMRTYLDETRGDLMRAIGDYHSHTPPLNQAYQAMVLGSASKLFAGGKVGPTPPAPAHPR